MPPLRDATVVLPDGRRLAFTEWGRPDGAPVLDCHGMPGSRLWCPDEAATVAAGVRLIVPDRPGIGRSDPLAGRGYGDWPRDVVALADALGIASFSVVGVSAGGPYAAACAALIPDRVRRVEVVSSGALTTHNWEERPSVVDDWSPEERAQFELTQTDEAAAGKLAAAAFARSAEPLEAYPTAIRTALEAAAGDRWFFDDEARTAVFDAHLREAWRQGLEVMQWELIDAFHRWGFRLADISLPVGIWHGDQDPWVSQDDIDFQVRTIPNARLTVWQDSGHLGFVKHWGEVMAAAAGPVR